MDFLIFVAMKIKEDFKGSFSGYFVKFYGLINLAFTVEKLRLDFKLNLFQHFLIQGNVFLKFKIFSCIFRSNF